MRRFLNGSSRRWTLIAMAMAIAGSAVVGAAAEPRDCAVSEDVRARIEATLCGGLPEYDFSGGRCFELSLAQRLRDTEAQVAKLEDCGYPDLSAALREAGLTVANALNAVAVCLPGGRVNVAALAESAADTVRNQGRSRRCTAEEQRLMDLRLEDFRALVRRAEEPGIARDLHRAMGVRVGPDGIVTDR